MSDYIARCDECGQERVLHRSGGDHLCDGCLRAYWEEDDADESDTPPQPEPDLTRAKRG